MKTLGLAVLTLASAFLLSLGSAAIGGSTKPAIVLVHGTWADGSSWQKVIPILQRDGYGVTAVQNPLTSLPDDIATTKRVIDALRGPIVAVGHSYGGAVITAAAAGNANVKALVYLSAFAPEPGEALTAPVAKFAPAPAGAATITDAAGFVYLDRAKFRDVFCRDLSIVDAGVMAATQKPVSKTVFGAGATVASAAWKTIPSWYIVTSQDRAINPDLQRFYAKRIRAKTTEIRSSHVSFLSHPNEVARVIKEAAGSTQR